LARLQTFPDSYELPARNADAARIIGNAIPPALAQAMLTPLVAALIQQKAAA
jgi:site-specific DNA-cytosine methylase